MLRAMPEKDSIICVAGIYSRLNAFSTKSIELSSEIQNIVNFSFSEFVFARLRVCLAVNVHK